MFNYDNHKMIGMFMVISIIAIVVQLLVDCHTFYINKNKLQLKLNRETLHGLVMIFWPLLPMVIPLFINGLGISLDIIAIGNSDVTYPRCNNVNTNHLSNDNFISKLLRIFFNSTIVQCQPNESTVCSTSTTSMPTTLNPAAEPFVPSTVPVSGTTSQLNANVPSYSYIPFGDFTNYIGSVPKYVSNLQQCMLIGCDSYSTLCGLTPVGEDNPLIANNCCGDVIRIKFHMWNDMNDIIFHTTPEKQPKPGACYAFDHPGVVKVTSHPQGHLLHFHPQFDSEKYNLLYKLKTGK
jgi:hypothetical protein